MIKALAALVILSATAARAEKPNPIEIGVHAATLSLLMVDMMQTLDIKNHPTYREGNQILGDRPSDLKIVGYFGGVMAVSTLVWYIAPPVARYFVDAPIVYFELPIVINNHTQWGLKMRLPF